jgi:hypothetical protein
MQGVIVLRGSMEHKVDELIESFVLDTMKGITLLHDQKLFGQMLVLLYSSIDALGLLDAPESQTEATGTSYKEWVKKYILDGNAFLFNEVDFWAARCSVLHTLTSKSKLSESNRAKQIQYFTGPTDSELAKAFIAEAINIDGGKHVPANIEEVYIAYLGGLQKFIPELAKNCAENQLYFNRVKDLLQKFKL